MPDGGRRSYDRATRAGIFAGIVLFIVAVLSGLLPRHRKSGRPEHEKKAAAKKQDGYGGGDTASVLDSIKQEYIAHNESHNRKERGKTWREYWTIGLLAVTVILTVMTYWVFKRQLDVSRKAADEAADEFHHDQRAWLEIALRPAAEQTHRTAYIYSAPSGQNYICWDYWLHNYGKSPAYQLTSGEFIRISGAWFTAAIGTGAGDPIGPTNEMYRSVCSPALPMTRTQLETDIKRDGFLAMKIVVYYTDLYESRGRTSACMQQLGSGAAQSCEPGTMY